MATIPASQIVDVVPNVLSAGGSALVLNGLLLDDNDRLPAGQVLSFPNDGASVAAYFGAAADEVTIADVYFGGFNISTKKPSAILFTRFAPGGSAAWLRSGPVDQLTLAQLQALSGSLSVVVDGTARAAASIDLSSATSFSSAASLIATGINGSPTQLASFTAAIAAGSASFTGSISGNVMTVTALASGNIVVGGQVSGTGVASGTEITGQLSGTTGGIGTYAVNIAQAVVSGSLAASYGTMTVSAIASGTISVGQGVTGSGVGAGTRVTALGTGTGQTGTYIVNNNAVVSSGSLSSQPVDVSVAYDSVRGEFVITSGIIGSPSTAAYATGTLAAGIYLTQATGATLSQGTAPVTPGAFMNSVVLLTQNWATFMLTFDPDDANGNGQKLAFAEWVNGSNYRYAYACVDNDVTATESNNATSSLGNIVKADDLSGTCVIYDPNGQHLDAFVCGSAASIDFAATNGRITFAFRGQDGLVAGVTDATTASNLIANGYNFYGAYATANQSFLEFQTGSVSGKFEWLDSYIDQIWLNNALQQALMTLLQQIGSVPYNAAGYELIKAACYDPINAALNFGAIRTGVTLSSLQASEINNAAGVKVSDLLQVQGWYLQVLDPTPQVRQARGTPVCNLWYLDGQSVQQITLNSVLVQ